MQLTLVCPNCQEPNEVELVDGATRDYTVCCHCHAEFQAYYNQGKENWLVFFSA